MTLGRTTGNPLLLCAGLAVVFSNAVSAQHSDNLVFHWSELEVEAARFDGVSHGGWDGSGWIGTDFDRFWWSTEGSATQDAVGSAEAIVLYGHYVRRFWDLVVGYRQDIEPVRQGYLTFGMAGLAPYWFEVEALGFISHRGQPSARFEVESDLLLTQRVIMTLGGEVDWLFTDDERLGLGSGISDLELGVRTRFEIRRKFAPYVEALWVREKVALPGIPTTAVESGPQLAVGLRLIY